MKASRNISGYGNTIKEKRAEAGLSQKDLAFKIGISQSNLCLIEKDKINLTEEEFNAINEILNIKEDNKDKIKAPKKRARKIKNTIGEMVEEVLNTKNLDKIVNEAVDETIAELDKEEEPLGEEDQNLADSFEDTIDEEEEEVSDEASYDLDLSEVSDSDLDADILHEDLDADGTILVPSNKIPLAQKNKLKASVIKMAQEPSDSIRFLVDFYYQTQRQRISADNRIRAILQGYDTTEDGKIPYFLQWTAGTYRNQEKTLKEVLGAYSMTSKVGRWLNDIVGVGPCISAGLLAYFKVHKKMRSCASFWTYAGLNDNNIPWLGTKRAASVMEEAKAVCLDRCKNRAEKYLSFQDPDMVKELKEIVKMKDSDMIFSKGANISDIKSILKKRGISKETIDAIVQDCSMYESKVITTTSYNTKIYSSDGIVIFYDTIKFLYDRVHPTNEFYWILAKALSRSERTLRNRSWDEKKSCYTYKNLKAFIAQPPYNVKLKTLCYKIGCSFIKQNKRGSMYGQLFLKRKEYETMKNERGDYADIAEHLLKTVNFKDKTTIEILESGKLTPKHITMRSIRWAVKIFISHLFDAMYIDAYGKTPEKAFPFDTSDLENTHIDWIAPEVPYEKYWDYKDNRKYGTISREYSPDYTVSFTRKLVDAYGDGDELDRIDSILSRVLDNVIVDKRNRADMREEEE